MSRTRQSIKHRIIGLFIHLVVIVLVCMPLMFIGSTQIEAVAASSCTYMELHPGYPGYQGYVTGVDGVGDFACVEDLEDASPGFSHLKEDRANRSAAKRLGISGSADVWTWENWMEIELERGLTPVTCYSCAFDSSSKRTPPSDTDITRNGPRLNCGAYGTTSIMDGLKSRPGYWAFGEIEHYQLRAVITLAYSDSHVNSEELIAGYSEVLDGLVNGKGGAGMIDAGALWDKMLSQGGYFPVAQNAVPNDQAFALELGLYGLIPFMPEDSFRMLAGNVDNALKQWGDAINRGQTDQSFCEYLISQGALNWF